MKVLGIIPARGGSKGIKDKNIKIIAGKPLIAYAIESAFQSKLIDKVVVSTDSESIKDIAENFGVDVIIRPDNLSEDSTPIFPVLLHTIEILEIKNEKFDLVVLLQPTSPIREGKNIDEVIKKFDVNPGLENVISVVSMQDIHPARMYIVDSDCQLNPLEQDWELARRQDIPAVYFRNGCIYAIRVNSMKKHRSVILKNKEAYIMPTKWLLNIDEERDLLLAEIMIEKWKKEGF